MAGRLIDAVVADGRVVVELFVDRIRAKQPGGVWECGSWMTGRIDRTKWVTFYVAECARCHDEIVAPGGRTAKQPPGQRRPQVATDVDREAWREHDLAMLGEKDD